MGKVCGGSFRIGSCFRNDDVLAMTPHQFIESEVFEVPAVGEMDVSAPFDPGVGEQFAEKERAWEAEKTGRDSLAEAVFRSLPLWRMIGMAHPTTQT